MAVKKSALYSSLWASCDSLRGGMDKIIAKLAEANSLRGVIDNAHFNEPDKLGKGQEMVDKLTELLSIFRDKMPSFSRQRR